MKQSIVLAAGTVDGAGTSVALSAAIRHLGNQTTSGATTVIVPEGFSDPALQGLTIERSSRRRAVMDEALGTKSAEIYIGFADRLPLRPRRGQTDVMVVQNPHLYGTESDWARQHPRKHRFLARWAKASARRADLIICSTSASRDDVIDTTGALPDRVVVRSIPANISQRKVEHRPDLTRILNVSDLYEYKRVDVALEAAAVFAQSVGHAVEFVQIGRPIEADAIQRLAKATRRVAASGVSVISMGTIPNAEVLAEMVRADVLILPSETESQGLPLVEAMSIGLPIVCRAIPVFIEQGGGNIIAVPIPKGTSHQGEVEAFAAGLSELATSERRRELSKLMIQAQASAVTDSGWDLLPHPKSA